jgi:hypothetical protein
MPTFTKQVEKKRGKDGSQPPQPNGPIFSPPRRRKAVTGEGCFAGTWGGVSSRIFPKEKKRGTRANRGAPGGGLPYENPKPLRARLEKIKVVRIWSSGGSENPKTGGTPKGSEGAVVVPLARGERAPPRGPSLKSFGTGGQPGLTPAGLLSPPPSSWNRVFQGGPTW